MELHSVCEQEKNKRGKVMKAPRNENNRKTARMDEITMEVKR